MAEVLLYSRGSHLILPDGGTDIPPDFRGQPLADWQRDQMTRQCNAFAAKGGYPDGTPGTRWRTVSTSARQNYGWRSLSSGSRTIAPPPSE